MWTLTGLPGEGGLQIADLALAFLLCALIGVKRENRQCRYRYAYRLARKIEQ
jgi:hypothetical protein